MTREEIKKIVEGITDEQLKAILDINSADIGKAKKDYEAIKEENDTLKADKKSLEDKIGELSQKSNSADDYKSQLETLQKEIKEKEDADRKAQEDAQLTDAIIETFGDKKFTSDYVKNGIIADMKTEIAKPENKRKSYSEIFEALTKDKNGIFENPNPGIEIPGMGSFDTNISDNSMRAVMGLDPIKE